MIRIGKIVATHGLQGWVVMTHITDASDWMKKGMALMAEMHKGSMIPFFVEDFKASADDEYLVKLEETDDIAEAKKLVRKHVYVQEEILASKARQSPLMWIGFQVTDVHKGVLGTIEDVMQTANQWLGKLEYEGKEVLLPLVPQMIKDVNIKNKRLIMELPEGLLEVYLG